MKEIAYTERRREVLEDLSIGRALAFHPAVLHQAAAYRWTDTGQYVPPATVKPLEEAGYVTVDREDYYGRVITEAGRAVLAIWPEGE